MSRRRILLAALPVTLAASLSHATDYSCNNLVPAGSRMICPGFEPNWAVVLICEEPVMSSNYIDAFSGDGITETPGNATVTSENPWEFTTSHGIAGSIAQTPAGCQDASGRFLDFTLTVSEQPYYDGMLTEICCRIEKNE